MGAPSRGVSLSSFPSMIVTKPNCWAGTQIFPWTSMVPLPHLHSHGALSTYVMAPSCTMDFLWAITMETRTLHMSAVEYNLSKVVGGISHLTLFDVSLSPCQWVLMRLCCDLFCLLAHPDIVLLLWMLRDLFNI